MSFPKAHALAALAVSLLCPAGATQCPPATIRSFQASPPNPVLLQTVFPGEYVVPGFTTNFVASYLGGLVPSYLFFACRTGGPTPLPPHLGSVLLDPSCIVGPIRSNSSTPQWIISIPNNANLLGGRVAAQSAHLANPSGLLVLSNALDFEIGFVVPDIGVASVVPASNMISGEGNRAHQVTLVNQGSAAASILVTVTIGPSWGTATLGPVAPGQSFTGTVFVPTPLIPFSCGGSQTFTVTACVPPGCRAPVCASASAAVASAYWDLDFQVINAPSSICRGSTTTWGITVINRGNVPSVPVCAISGIKCGPGAGNWPNCNLGLNFFQVPPLQPGQMWSYSVGSYFVPCNALLQTQFIAVEINYTAGCGDLCTSGNYAEIPTQIVWCGC